MNESVATAGNSGPKVRSDCEIQLQITSAGGIVVDVISKVKTLYGESIAELASEVLGFFGIRNALVKINDSGALPFVITARLEAALKKLIVTDLEYLPELIPQNCYSTERDRFRFSRLYLPGNSPGLMINAGLHSAEGIILDLEDSVAPEKKDESRFL
jgi:citrate lyase subunit beta/citryl-CoA lyase